MKKKDGMRLSKRRHVENELARELESIQDAPHRLFYSESEVARRFAISRQTARLAIGTLEREGLVYRMAGRGTFIAPRVRRKSFLLVSDWSVFDTHNYYRLNFLSGFLQALNADGSRYMPIFATTDRFVGQIDRLQHEYQGLAGVLFMDVQPMLRSRLELERIEIPYLLYESDAHEQAVPHEVNWHCFREREIMDAILGHLEQQGHTRIGLLSGKLERKMTFRRRYELWCEWMQRRGWNRPERFAFSYREFGNIETETEYVGDLLDAHRDLTALVCVDDYWAARAVNAALRRGIRVPDELAVTGVDNYDFSERLLVPITTVDIPLAEDAGLCAQALIQLDTGAATRIRSESRVRLVRRMSA